MKDKLSLYLLDNWKPKLISLVLALCVFTFFYYFNHSSRFITIPVEVILPSDYEAESLVVSSVEIEIIGDNSIIYLVDPSQIVAFVDYSFVNREGISKARVELNYNEDVFAKGKIHIKVNPEIVKVSFKPKE